MLPLLGSVLAASLLGSAHCAGMCGAFVCLYSEPGRASRWLPHAAYNLGRLLSYLALGALAGALGERLDRAGAAAGIVHGAALAAGAFMVVWGLGLLALALGARLPGAHGPAFLRRAAAAAVRRVGHHPPAQRALVIGLVSTLLPCGWLYGFAATAAGTGHPLGAMAVMAAFWAGTLPVMAGLGLAAQTALGPLRGRLPALTATALVVVGLLTVAGKLGPGLHAAPGSAAGAACPACAAEPGAGASHVGR